MSSGLVGAIEAGGTKFVCAVGTCPEDINEVRFPTTTPEETISKSIEFFTAKEKQFGKLEAIGIGTFGPADVKPSSSHYGWITSTPKENWQHTDLVSPIKKAIGDIPFAFDTDVNAAAWGEERWGAAKGLKNFIYITVGTGIGGGAVVDGLILHGKNHPEMGHLRVPRDSSVDPFPGCCPFHDDCLEGLASGTAIQKRWGVDPRSLPIDHEAWQLESAYLSDAILNLALTLSPERFILGGGVMEQKHLFPMIRSRLNERLADYINIENIDNFIVPPGLGSKSGVLGAISLATDLIS